jgi:hypothetical protein
MNDVAFGFVILAAGIVFVLAIVFAISLSDRPRPPRPTPPRGVHLPPPSSLPVLLSVGAALLGTGLVFRPEGFLVNPLFVVPGLAVLLVAVVGWVRAANREWRETEHGAHDAHAAHGAGTAHGARGAAGARGARDERAAH